MADNYREETTARKRGRSASKLSVRLFLLDPDKNVTKVTKEIGSEKGLNELKRKGYGPPSKEYCVTGDKVEFSLELTNEEFKQKLTEIYPSLKNACFMFMKAGKDNTLKELNPGVCCYRCYTPENVYSSERGQGKLYIRIIPENEISPCNHGMSFLKRLRSTVGGHQQFYVPILPKPVATVVSARIEVTTSPSTSAATSIARPTNNQLLVSSDQETQPWPLTSNLPALDLSSSLISVAQGESTPAGQNSGNMVTETSLLSTTDTILPIPRVNFLQDPLSVSEAATRPEAQSSCSMVIQGQLAASSIVSQSSSTPGAHNSIGRNSPPRTLGQLPTSATISQVASTPPVSSSFHMLSQRQLATLATNSLPLPSQPFGSSVDMMPPGQLLTSASVSQIASTPPVNGTLPQEQLPMLVRNSLPTLNQPFNNYVDMVPQRQPATLSTISEFVRRPVEPFVSGNMTVQSQIPRSREVSNESLARSLLDKFLQLINQSGYVSLTTELEAEETGSQVASETITARSNSVSSALVASTSSSVVQTPNLNLLAEAANSANVQGNLELEQDNSSIVDFIQNVESTGKLEISLDVVNDDALLKKLNESTINIHTVEIQSTCKVHQVLEKFSIPSCLEVLRIRENSLNFEDVTVLLKFLHSVNNLDQLDLCCTKFTERTFFIFISALHYCNGLTSLILTDNSLTEQEINGLITVFESLKNLKTLNLSKCILTEIQANAILHKHEQAKNIVSLNLSQNAIQGSEIVVGICQLQCLQELDLSHNCVRFSPLPNFKGKCNHLSTCLKNISLSSNHMKPTDISDFCSLIRSDLLELNLDSNHVGRSIRSLGSLGRKINHLKVLSLANTDIFGYVGDLVSLLWSIKKLEDLNLSSNNLLAEDFEQLRTPLSKLTLLKTLNLSMNVIGPDGMKAFADLLKVFTLLERLDVNSSYIREDEVSVLCKSLVSLKKLKCLDLSGNIINAEVLDETLVFPSKLKELLFSDIIHGEKIFAKMSQLQNLRKLYLNEPSLRECDAQALATMLPYFPKLEELSLTDLEAPEYEAILTAIKSLKNIKKIDLTGMYLGNEKPLVDMLSSLSSLEELALYHMSDTKVDHKRIFKTIKLLKYLRKLSLVGIYVPAAAKSFFDMLSSCSNLEDIVFPRFYSRFSSDRIAKNFSSLESLRYMKKLDLRGIILKNSTAQALARVLPSLQLLEKLKFKLELDNEESSKQLFVALRSLKYLKELVVISKKGIDTSGLVEVLPSLQLLEKVKLDLLASDEHSKPLFGALGNLRYIKVLGCPSITNSNAETFAHALSSLPLLEKLDFTTKINAECAEKLYATLGNLKYLRKLFLQIVNPTNREAELLAKVLPSLELLEELELIKENWINSKHEKKVIAAIGKLGYLKKLRLDCDKTSFAYLEALDEILLSLPMLKKLKLFGINYKNQSKKKGPFIAFGKVKHLTKLYFHWIRITQTNVDALVEGLASLQMLEELKLRVSCYSCKHDCDGNCDDECDHDCLYECKHKCNDKCRDECDHDCYDDSCQICRHYEHERGKNYVQTKVLTVVKKMKYFKKFILDDDLVEIGR